MQSFFREHEDSDRLSIFLNLLKTYNKGDIKVELKEKIEEHFRYTWGHDRTSGISTDEDLRYYDELGSD